MRQPKRVLICNQKTQFAILVKSNCHNIFLKIHSINRHYPSIFGTQNVRVINCF